MTGIPDTRGVDRLASLTVVVLTHNEERNLASCLASVADWAGRIFVVDSGSTDRTVEIAERYGATVGTHPFESHAKQWNWALEHLPTSAEWILALDADQCVTAELRDEISKLVQREDASQGEVVGWFVSRRQIFRGVWIKHGGYYPKYLLKLFRRGHAWADESDLVDHHFRVKGRVEKLRGDIIEDNRNERDISIWVAKHNRYAALQALEEVSQLRPSGEGSTRASFTGSPDERTRWLKNVWRRLPLYIRPFLYFFYRYVVRLGFLDGKPGFIFHFLQAFWYRLLVDIKLDELRRKRESDGA